MRIVLTTEEARNLWDEIPEGEALNNLADAIEQALDKLTEGNQVSVNITFTIVPTDE